MKNNYYFLTIDLASFYGVNYKAIND